ncbi:uncharacterized protein LOC115769276 [Drosophila novamexicana]|uniref:uncharacterized protein LOC115769276 n=1 Tax=Drosophila novamexicana TaxID=47314 RepID=UPI0011E599EC|nr:uncharacterized protein LOC115769276 [Drosophila novamexicana]
MIQSETTAKHDNVKSDTTVTLSSEVKVLSIGNRRPHYRSKKKQVVKFDMNVFLDNCKKHFGLLLMGTRTPKEVAMNWSMIQLLEMKRIEEDNQVKHFQFYCHPRGRDSGYMMYGQTVNAEAVLHDMRKRLQQEKWTSKYVLEMPVNETCYKGYRSKVDQIFAEALDAERYRIFQFVYYLHKEHLKKKLAM